MASVNENLLNSAALITGASAGLGRVYARSLAKRQVAVLILVARRKERLRELEEELRKSGYLGRVELIVCDLRDYNSREMIHEHVKGTGLEVGLLVNNAGFGYVGSFLSDDTKNELDMVETNCVAPLHLAKLFLPQMVSRSFGGIINLASVAAFPPLPYMATYGATKALLLNWSIALAEEVKGSGVNVLAVCPGPTESEFHIVAGVSEKIVVVPAMSAEVVVEQSLVAFFRGQRIVVTGFANKLLAFSTRFVSKVGAAKVALKMLRARVPENRR